MGAAGGAARDGAAAPCWGQTRGISARATGSVGRGGPTHAVPRWGWAHRHRTDPGTGSRPRSPPRVPSRPVRGARSRPLPPRRVGGSPLPPDA